MRLPSLCILQTAWYKGISKDLSWGLKVLLKFLFISAYVLNSSFPSELVISFQPAECQLLSQQQRVTSVSPGACQQPLTCHFFIPHTSNAWQDQDYFFPTGFAPKTWNSRAQSMWGSEPQVMKSKTKQIAKVTLTLVCHFWTLYHFWTFCHLSCWGGRSEPVCSHGPWPHIFFSNCAALTPGIVLGLTTIC